MSKETCATQVQVDMGLGSCVFNVSDLSFSGFADTRGRTCLLEPTVL